MQYNVKRVSKEYDFYITGASYAGEPKDNTAMYISRKVEHLVQMLSGKRECLVFVETGVNIPEELKKDNCFIVADNPQFAYAEFALQFAEEQKRQEAAWGYTLTDGGYYIGKHVTVGENAYIEPGVLIGHCVQIGDNAEILAGAVIKHAVIGDCFLCNENAVIGNNGFTMACDEAGNKYRIPALGGIQIGNNVEVGACDDVARGACGDTILEDYVKLDSLVHVGHEAHLKKNVEIIAGSVVGGFTDLEESAYLGMNASIRNRIKLGCNCVVGMGAVVTKPVDRGDTVVGNPAKHLLARSAVTPPPPPEGG